MPPALRLRPGPAALPIPDALLDFRQEAGADHILHIFPGRDGRRSSVAALAPLVDGGQVLRK